MRTDLDPDEPGRDQWSIIGEVRSITRIPPGEWPGHYSPPTA
jgi:hypothetical protein